MREQSEIDLLIKPVKPKYWGVVFGRKSIVETWIYLLGPLCTLVFCLLTKITATVCIIYIIFGGIFGPFWLLAKYSDYNKLMETYKADIILFSTNKIEWCKAKEKKKLEIEEKYRQKAKAALEEEEAYQRTQGNVASPQIHCPSCGGTNVVKITTVDRSISIAVVGLASGKIGKQYQCRHCKHLW